MPLTCMHGGSGCVVTMTTIFFCGNLVVADFLTPTSTSPPLQHMELYHQHMVAGLAHMKQWAGVAGYLAT